MALLPSISIITLYVTELNTPIKQQTWAEWVFKNDPTIYMCYLQETHFKHKCIGKLKVRGWERCIIQTSQKIGVATMITK